jgi:hypothetical protein
MSTDTQAARAIMEKFVDDEYLSTQLGLEDAIAEALAAARAGTWKRAIDIVQTETPFINGNTSPYEANAVLRRKIIWKLEYASKEA